MKYKACKGCKWAEKFDDNGNVTQPCPSYKQCDAYEKDIEEESRKKIAKEFYSMIMKGRENFSKDSVITIAELNKCLKEFCKR